ncbi:MAG: hydrogenase 3 maturation endopeptidase HyCI [Thermoprotei archaeon]|nr:MAG: hydrogenase 3 maturation endopeptidase HyCI [Thermoprotei archaeon]RLF18921.1 MAG: hydrogenase 3 maturation endopeptidase HyCI [Thermoprotei archaeon]
MTSLLDRLVGRLRGARKVVLLGVGNPLRGDDAVGPLFARRVRKFKPSWVLVLDCGSNPENYTGSIRRFKPSHVVVVDAVEAGKPPGSIELYSEDELAGLTLDTHKPSLRLLATYIKESINSEFLLIGIQPKRLTYTFKASLSKPVRAALSRLEEDFKELFRRLELEQGCHHRCQQDLGAYDE